MKNPVDSSAAADRPPTSPVKAGGRARHRRLPAALVCALFFHATAAAAAFHFAAEQRRKEALLSQLTPFLMEIDTGDGVQEGKVTGAKDATGLGIPRKRAEHKAAPRPTPIKVKRSRPQLLAQNELPKPYDRVETESMVDSQNAGDTGDGDDKGTADGTGTDDDGDGKAARMGIPGGKGSGLGGLAKAPSLQGGMQWDCPFPPEADDAGVDHAVVMLRVDVGVDGSVLNAQPLRDPGHGFGREARQCATRKRWSPGLSSTGTPAAAMAVVSVKFDR